MHFNTYHADQMGHVPNKKRRKCDWKQPAPTLPCINVEAYWDVFPHLICKCILLEKIHPILPFRDSTPPWPAAASLLHKPIHLEKHRATNTCFFLGTPCQKKRCWRPCVPNTRKLCGILTSLATCPSLSVRQSTNNSVKLAGNVRCNSRHWTMTILIHTVK